MIFLLPLLPVILPAIIIILLIWYFWPREKLCEKCANCGEKFTDLSDKRLFGISQH